MTSPTTSPSTSLRRTRPGLRDLQDARALADLLPPVLGARDEKTGRRATRTPILLKIAPDLTEADLDDIAAELRSIVSTALIVSNTTLSRTGLTRLCGCRRKRAGCPVRPLFERSTAVLAKLRQRIGPAPALVGVGGVDSAETALDKIRAGADLVQLYTGLVYGGPGLVARIVRGLSTLCDREGLTGLSALRDTRADVWAMRKLADQ